MESDSLEPESRPAVLFVHGSGGGGWEWHVWRAVFEARGWAVFAPDLQPASAGLPETALGDYIAQVESHAVGMAVAPVLIGASMGGLLALKVAERVPVAALVLVNSIPPLGVPGWPDLARIFPALIPWSKSALEATRESLPDADEETIRWTHARWRDESGRVMRALYEGVPAAPRRCPALVIAGREDREVRPEVGMELARRLGADFACFDGVSHLGALLGRRAPAIAGLACHWLAAALQSA